jgi:O-antigen ligase
MPFVITNFWQYVKDFFSLETIFVLFLFSYQYKNAHPFFLDPDITTVLMGILLPLSIYSGLKEKCTRFKSFESIIFIVLVVFILISLYQLEAPSRYSKSKALVFLIFTAPAYMIAYHVIAARPERLMRLFKVFIGFALLVHIEAYRAFIANDYQITDVLGNNYLVTGQTLSVGFLILTILSFYQLHSYFSWGSAIPAMILWGTLTFISLNLGGRGPVISLSIALACLYGSAFIIPAYRSFALKQLALLIGSSVTAYWILKGFFQLESSHFMTRLSQLTVTTADTTLMDQNIVLRLAYYRSAFHAFLDNPLFGIGIGKWPEYNGYVAETAPLHPHNIFLELAAELGVIGGILPFIGLSVRWIRSFSVRALHSSPVLNISFMLFILSLANACKSGDLNDNILLFTALGLFTRQYNDLLSLNTSNNLNIPKKL